MSQKLEIGAYFDAACKAKGYREVARTRPDQVGYTRGSNVAWIHSEQGAIESSTWWFINVDNGMDYKVRVDFPSGTACKAMEDNGLARGLFPSMTAAVDWVMSHA